MVIKRRREESRISEGEVDRGALPKTTSSSKNRKEYHENLRLWGDNTRNKADKTQEAGKKRKPRNEVPGICAGLALGIGGGRRKPV